MAEKKPRKPTIAQPKIKMLSPAKPGKRQRVVNVDADKRSEYTQKGYKYIGLGEQEFNVADKPRKTREPRSLKKPKPLIGVTEPVASDTTGAKFYKRQLEMKNKKDKLIEQKLKKQIQNLINEVALEPYVEHIVATIITQALTCIKKKDYDEAVLKLVSAAGTLSKICPNAIGFDKPTGNGYKLIKVS